MRGLFIFLFLFIFHFSFSAEPRRTTEQEQQFKYYWYAAKQAITEERYDDAYVLLAFCNAIQPNDGSTLCCLGIIEQGIGNTLKGLMYLRDAFEANPQDQWYHYYRSLMDTDNAVAKARAVEVLEKAYRVQRKNGKADEDLLERLRASYLQSAQWKKALALQDEIEAIQGYTTENTYYRFHLYGTLGKDKKAIQAVDRYLEQHPDELEYLPASILNNYAYYIATHKGDLQKAEKMSAITIRQEPNNPVFLDTYGWILHLQGQNELAYFYLMKALWNETDETKEDIKRHLKTVKEKIDIYEK